MNEPDVISVQFHSRIRIIQIATREALGGFNMV